MVRFRLFEFHHLYMLYIKSHNCIGEENLTLHMHEHYVVIVILFNSMVNLIIDMYMGA